MITLTFQFHGVRVRVRTSSSAVASHFRHDFSYFIAEPRGSVDLELQHGIGAPKWRKGRRVGRAELFKSPPGERRVRYFGSVAIDYRPQKGKARVYAGSSDGAYEGCLSVVLSFVGEWLDRKGIHRIHALGVASETAGALFLAPSGTGKSTLALELLKRSRLRLLSDDTPLVTAEAEMLGFPQRIACREKPKGIPKRHLRRFRRARYGEKFVVGAAAFRSRVADRAGVDWVVLTRRDGTAKFEAIARWRAAWPLAKWLVAGFETPQMWELFLRPSPEDWKAKTEILRSRLRAAWGLMRMARFGALSLGSDAGENVRLVEGLLGR